MSTVPLPEARSPATSSDAVFPFGENWRRFLSQLTPEQIDAAAASLRSFLGEECLRGKRFLDVGCGSGLFSYAAAVVLGTSEVLSLDADAKAVACARELWRRAGEPRNWTIRHGSILDPAFVASLGTADIVYAWGVLHHTGSMWEALDRTARLVAPGGVLYLALYNRVGGPFGSKFWWHVKRWYVTAPHWQQTRARQVFRLLYGVRNVLRGKPSVQHGDVYAAEKRGMALKTDVHDWLGGFPYEYATANDVLSHVQHHFSEFSLVKLREAPGLENNWYLFRSHVRDHREDSV
ncbi:MAG: methyltransferase family protein [Parcubacteria group bacterium Gr01-1014_38]|nr:MAG: methyltransferase family protein [Parcubacteria group bacterium Gr01-1014_38]